MELIVKLKKKDLKDYIDYRFTVYHDGKEVLNAWTGEPLETWDWITKMIVNTVKGTLAKEKPDKEKK